MSMSVSVVLVRSQPSGFTMSICSVKRFRRSAPRNSGSRWNTVRQFRMLFFTPPFCVPSNVSRISSGVCAGSIVSIVLFDRFLRFRRQALKFAAQAAPPPFLCGDQCRFFLLFLRITKYPKGILCSLSSATLPQKRGCQMASCGCGRVLFSNAPAGADNRIAPGNNTVPFPEISAPLIFLSGL